MRRLRLFASLHLAAADQLAAALGQNSLGRIVLLIHLPHGKTRRTAESWSWTGPVKCGAWTAPLLCVRKPPRGVHASESLAFSRGWTIKAVWPESLDGPQLNVFFSLKRGLSNGGLFNAKWS